jgi:putative membrane protein
MTNRAVVPYQSGPYGDPPTTRIADYGRVLSQLLYQLRFDLLFFIPICTLLISFDIPEGWLLNNKAVSGLGIAMSIFIGFRTSDAISRWWEARKLWGAIINISREWADVLRSHLSPDHWNNARTHRMVQFQVALVWQLNFQLRNFWHPDLRRMLDQLLQTMKLPSTSTVRSLSSERAAEIQAFYQDDWINDWGRIQLVEVSNRFTDATGGLERIRNTPIPAAYDMVVRSIIWVFGTELMLTFKELKSPITGIMLFVTFIVAERIASYVEGPFDRDGSSFSLPLNGICSTISKDLVPGELDFGRFQTTTNPSRWD